MKRYRLVTSGGGVQHMVADSLRQAGDYVTFYTDKEASGIVRLGAGDGVYFDKDMVEAPPKPCPDCGNLPGERGEDAMKASEPLLAESTAVRLKDQGERVYRVRGSERRQGLTFYTLKEIGGLFLRGSLERVDKTLGPA